jgi:hypothetical protein
MAVAAHRPDYDPAVVARGLGLTLSDRDYEEGKRLYEGAVRVLQEWEARQQRLRSVVASLRDPDSTEVETKGYTLALEVHRAGLRAWLQLVSSPALADALPLGDMPQVRSILPFLPGVPRRTPADLRMWCLLQLKAVQEVVPRAYPAPEFYWREWRKPERGETETVRDPRPEDLGVLLERAPSPAKDDIWLPDLMLLHEVSWLLTETGSPQSDDPEKLVFMLSCLFWVWPREGRGSAEFPPPQYPSLVSLAWAAMRDLATRLDAPYPEEPSETGDTRACRNALDRVVQWCLERDSSRPSIADTTAPSPAGDSGPATPPTAEEGGGDDSWIFAPDGDGYFISAFGTSGHFQRLRGFDYLAKLIAEPAQDVLMAELVRDKDDEGIKQKRDQHKFIPPQEKGEEYMQEGFGKGDDAPDEEAIQQVRDRLAGIEEELEEARQNNDIGRVGKLQEEEETLREYTLKRRWKSEDPDLTRLRSRIYSAMKKAYRALRKAKPPMTQLAAHFEVNISASGETFSYRPEPRPAWSPFRTDGRR